MNFFDNNKNFILSRAQYYARYISRKTGSSDREDFQQELCIAILIKQSQYNSKRACQHTFINVVMRSKARDIITKMFNYRSAIQAYKEYTGD